MPFSPPFEFFLTELSAVRASDCARLCYDMFKLEGTARGEEVRAILLELHPWEVPDRPENGKVALFRGESLHQTRFEGTSVN